MTQSAVGGTQKQHFVKPGKVLRPRKAYFVALAPSPIPRPATPTMKKTSDKLATFIGKKLNQAATVLDKSQARPSRPPSPPVSLPQPQQKPAPPEVAQPQQGQPLYPSAEQCWFDTVDTTTYQAYHTPSYTTSITTTPTPPNPVSNVSLPSPYPPNSSNRGLKSGYLYDTSVSSSSTMSGHSSYIAQTPSPYILPPTASTSQTSIPPPPPISSKLAQFPPNQPEQHITPPSTPLTNSHTLHNNARDPIPTNLFQTIVNRTKQAAQNYPNMLLPMSRILDPSNEPDLQLWYHQLQTSPTKAIIPTPTTTITDTPTFALSFTTSDKPFSDLQRCRLQFILKALSSHTKQLRLILPSQPHTRLLPPSIYPTISLSTRDTEQSQESATQFWPFLEEVAALWGAGIIFAAQSRGSNIAGFQQVLSYVRRRELPVVETVQQCLRNVYFGAVDKHHGYSQEVMEIAKWAPNGICLGQHWREVLVKCRNSKSVLPPNDVYLDGSRTDDCSGWRHLVGFVKKCLLLNTDRGSYFLVNRADSVGGIWLLLGVDGRKVAWSKVMSGACVVGLDTCEWSCVERAVGGQIGPVRVLHVRECDISEIG